MALCQNNFNLKNYFSIKYLYLIFNWANHVFSLKISCFCSLYFLFCVNIFFIAFYSSNHRCVFTGFKFFFSYLKKKKTFSQQDFFFCFLHLLKSLQYIPGNGNYLKIIGKVNPVHFIIKFKGAGSWKYKHPHPRPY